MSIQSSNGLSILAILRHWRFSSHRPTRSFFKMIRGVLISFSYCLANESLADGQKNPRSLRRHL